MQNHIVTAVFGGSRIVKTRAIFKYDQGMELQIKGLTLPDTFSVDFANESSTTSVSMTGQDGIVAIPDQFLLNGENVIAWIVLHDTENDSETVYTIIIPVKERAERTDIEPTPVQQQQIDSLVTAMNNTVAAAGEYADEAERQADRAETASLNSTAKAEIATQAAESASASAQSASDSTASAEASAGAAAQSASAAETSASSAADSVAQAHLYATQAGDSSSSASDSAVDAQRHAQAASASATSAETAATSATASATTATTKAAEATTSAGTAATNATTALNAASQAAQSATQAAASVTSAQTAQTAAEAAQTGAQTAQTAAESAAASAEAEADRAEGYADRLIDVYPTDTASGTIASFTDGADDVEIKSATVQIEPVQDLHGYENPWPAGGGKNILPIPTWYSAGYEETQYGVKFTVQSDGSVKVVGTNNSQYNCDFYLSSKNANPQKNPFYLANGTYTFIGWGLSTNCHLVTSGGGGNGFEYTDISTNGGYKTSTVTDGTKPFNYVIIRVPSGATVNTTVYLQVSEGSTVPTAWSPYSNLCPISGWDAVTVYGTGANVWDEQWELGYYANGVKDRSSQNIRCVSPIPVKGNTTYYVHYPDTHGARIQFLDGEGAFISDLGYKANTTFTTPANCRYIVFYTNAASGITTYNNDISINYPSTDHDYHAYNGDTYDISWESEAGTVYGGTLTYEGDGVWTVESSKAYALLNDPDKWIVTSGTANFYYDVTFDSRKIYDNSYSGLTCSYVPCVYGAEPYGRWNSATGKRFCIKSSALTLEQVKADASAGNIAIVYDLATPTTCTLTTEQVVTLLGQNNFWADCGDISVEYRADIGLYIDKKTAAILAALS